MPVQTGRVLRRFRDRNERILEHSFVYESSASLGHSKSTRASANSVVANTRPPSPTEASAGRNDHGRTCAWVTGTRAHVLLEVDDPFLIMTLSGTM